MASNLSKVKQRFGADRRVSVVRPQAIVCVRSRSTTSLLLLTLSASTGTASKWKNTEGKWISWGLDTCQNELVLVNHQNVGAWISRFPFDTYFPLIFVILKNNWRSMVCNLRDSDPETALRAQTTPRLRRIFLKGQIGQEVEYLRCKSVSEDELDNVSPDTPGANRVCERPQHTDRFEYNSATPSSERYMYVLVDR